MSSFIFPGLIFWRPIRVAARSKALTPAHIPGSWFPILLEEWLCVFFILYLWLLLLLLLFAKGWSLVQGILPNVYKMKKLKKRPRPDSRGYRVINNTIIFWRFILSSYLYAQKHFIVNMARSYTYVYTNDSTSVFTFMVGSFAPLRKWDDVIYRLLTPLRLQRWIFQKKKNTWKTKTGYGKIMANYTIPRWLVWG
jgi:hypothetical protein